MLNQNNVVIGLILGTLIPVLGYLSIDAIFNVLDQAGIMDPDGFSFTWRERTTSLLAICMNLIPFQIYKNKRHDQSMRGLIFPTLCFVAYWAYHFKDALFDM